MTRALRFVLRRGPWLLGAMILGCGPKDAPPPHSAPAPDAAPSRQESSAGSAATAAGTARPGTVAPGVDSAAPTAEEFLEREREWAHALHVHDGPFLDRLLAPEFLITGVGSTVADPVGGRAEWLQNVDRYPWPEHEVSDVRLAASGDVAVVKCIWTGVYPPNSLTDRGGALELLMTDVWLRRDGAWVVLARHTSLPRSDGS